MGLLATNTLTKVPGQVPALTAAAVTSSGFPIFLLSDDTRARRLVLTLLGSLGQAWTFDPRTGSGGLGPTWTLAPQPGTSTQPGTEFPPLLVSGYGSEVTFDTTIGRTVVFSSGVLATYDAVAGTWAIVPSGPRWPTQDSYKEGRLVGPLARGGHTLVYDSVNHRVLMFGGVARMPSGMQFLDDVWAYYPATNTWTEIVAAKHPVTRQ